MRRRDVIRQAGAGAALVLAAAAPIARAAGQGKWLRLTSRNFEIYSQIDESRLRNEASALEGFVTALRSLFRVEDPGPSRRLPVYLVRTRDEVKQAWPRAGDNIGGFYRAGVEETNTLSLLTPPRPAAVTAGLVDRDIRDYDSRVRLFHEQAHHFMLAHASTFYPAWYVEGFAEFVSTAEFEAGGAVFGQFTVSRARWLTRETWLPIEQLLAGTPWKLSGDDVPRFYSLAWLATHYLFNNKARADGFQRYVAALAAGGDILGAFEPAFGITPAAFHRELRDYHHAGLAFLKVQGAQPAPEAVGEVERLPPSADDLLLPMSFLRALPAPQWAADTVAKVRRQAAAHPGDPFAALALARTEAFYGDIETARVALIPMAAADPASAEVRHLLGVCELRKAHASKAPADFLTARRSFAAAARLDPDRAGTLYRYAECVFHEKGAIDAPTLDVLLKAHRLTPQTASIGLTAARALAVAGRPVEAEALLRPIAANPHGGWAGRTAQGVLAAMASGATVRMEFYSGLDRLGDTNADDAQD